MRFGGIVLAVLLTLGACSSDPEPKEPKRTATSATPTATPPTMPAQAKEDTPEGAFSFSRHFVDTLNFGVSTGATEPLASLSSESCSACVKYRQTIESDHRDGGQVEGFKWTITDGEVLADSSVKLEVDASEYRKKSTKKPSWTVVPKAHYKFEVALRHVDGSWQVQELYTEGSSE